MLASRLRLGAPTPRPAAPIAARVQQQPGGGGDDPSSVEGLRLVYVGAPQVVHARPACGTRSGMRPTAHRSHSRHSLAQRLAPSAPNAVAAALVAAVAATLWRAPLEDALVYGDIGEAIDDLIISSGSGFGPGDVVGGLLWAVALWFVTPLQVGARGQAWQRAGARLQSARRLAMREQRWAPAPPPRPPQLLLLFLGKIETERPSDEVMTAIGRVAGLRRAARVPGAGVHLHALAACATAAFALALMHAQEVTPWRGLSSTPPCSVDAVEYEAPTWVRATAAGVSLAAGLGTAALFSVALGDATWSVSSGIGALFAAGIYEVCAGGTHGSPQPPPKRRPSTHPAAQPAPPAQVGRPERVSGAAAIQLEEQWQDFGGWREAAEQAAGWDATRHTAQHARPRPGPTPHLAPALTFAHSTYAARFAERRLQRSGRCHESEASAAAACCCAFVPAASPCPRARCRRRPPTDHTAHAAQVWAAFRRDHVRYRSPDVITDATLRTMVANWAPAAERTRSVAVMFGQAVHIRAQLPCAAGGAAPHTPARTPSPPARNGFYKNVSLQQFTDAFTGETRGSAPAPAAAEPARGALQQDSDEA